METGSEHLLATLADGVLTLTLNRPEARNALGVEMLDALSEQLARAETSPNVRCIVLTGNGKGFCEGGDVKAMAQGGSGTLSAAAMDDFIHRQRVIQRSTAGKLFKLLKPTLAVINGAAAGAGLSLAMACHLRIMADDAILTTAFSRIGVSGDFGETYFMTRWIGTAQARELFFLSDKVSAQRAVTLGLVNWSCSPELLPEQSSEIARRLARGSSIAYRYIKENLNRAMTGDIDDCLDIEATHHVHCTATGDHHAAAAAFIGKSVPVFTGT